MLRRTTKIGLLLATAWICGVATPVFADSADSVSGLAGSAALLEQYYNREAGQETEEPESEEAVTEETSVPVTSEAETPTEEETTEQIGETEPEAAETDAAESDEPEAESEAGDASETQYEQSDEAESGEETADAWESRLAEARTTALNTYDNLGMASLDGGYLNVREKASTEATVIGQMENGDACEILDAEDGWYYISSGSVEGYVSSDYILTGDAAEEAAVAAMVLKIQITTETLNVRTEPSEDASVLTQVGIDERYDFIENLGDWIEIEVNDDSSGYVSSDYVKLRYTLPKATVVEPEEESEEAEEASAEVSLRDQIVSYAMQFLGNPYVWGGESLTNGCDCSGFTMLIYRHFGISLPHYSVSQSKKGRTVDSGSMQPGDLVFYASGGTINHVAMYIGNGQVIGAQSTKSGIAIRSWNYRTPVKIVSVLG
ncbi:MAG: C40 family peptidase [Lachnospiraceae bacterium]|nr:C40 family peptidase [Lachnospiraceae bacterium]